MQDFKLRLATNWTGLHRVETIAARDQSEALSAARQRLKTSRTFDSASVFHQGELLAEVDRDGLARSQLW
jgi:hypothetical protein